MTLNEKDSNFEFEVIQSSFTYTLVAFVFDRGRATFPPRPELLNFTSVGSQEMFLYACLLAFLNFL